MSLPSDDVAELRILVEDQAAQIQRLLQERNSLFSKVESTENNLKNALELQLKSIKDEKKELEDSMEVLQKQQEQRASEFGKQIKELHTAGESDESNAGSEKFVVSQQSIDSLNNTEELRAIAKMLLDRNTAQDQLIKKLKFELEMEAGHVNILRADNQSLKKLTVSMQASAEQSEEFISNKLLKSINSLKKEKGELLLRVEQEEEMITKTLKNKLSQLQREKVEMEIALEQEQEFIVNRLQKQLEALRASQNSNSAFKKWHLSHSPSASSIELPLPTPVSPAMVEMMKAENQSLRMKILELEREFEENVSTFRENYTKAKEEISKLREKQGLPTSDIETIYPPGPIIPTVISRANSHSSLHRKTSEDSSRDNVLIRTRTTSGSMSKSSNLHDCCI
ncbi:hypothetical protein HK098_000004 [Nowakowskiella sp. JEL0407]|nr:hypothetical protein HK098_000004 [Nowakowskiella sp. JEL0407]